MPDRAGAGLVPLVPGLLGRQANHSGPSLSIPRIDRHESCQSLPAISTRPRCCEDPERHHITAISATAILRPLEAVQRTILKPYTCSTATTTLGPATAYAPEYGIPNKDYTTDSKRAGTFATNERTTTTVNNYQQSIKLSCNRSCIAPSDRNCVDAISFFQPGEAFAASSQKRP